MHVGIIMDGNGRWAAARGKERNAGHREGSKNVDRIVRAAADLGVAALSVYAFSTENWKRPEKEVNGLFDLLSRFIKDKRKTVLKNNIVFRSMGDLSRLPAALAADIKKLTEESRGNSGIVLNIAVNYGGRDEIVSAAKAAAAAGEEITEASIENKLYTHGLADPDLIIRTGGQVRLSNFMLWQAAYSELYFTDILWPDFDENELKKAIEYYNGRKRNYGGI